MVTVVLIWVGCEDERECKVMRYNCWIGVWLRRRWQEWKRRTAAGYGLEIFGDGGDDDGWWFGVGVWGVGRSWVGWGLGGEGWGCSGGGGRRAAAVATRTRQPRVGGEASHTGDAQNAITHLLD